MWFDFLNTGDSEGQPRDEVAHYGRLQDWVNAIASTTSLSEVDAQRVGIWGTSLGGRDVLVVAGIERRLKAVVSQTPLIRWTAAAGARMAGYGDDMRRYQQDLAADRESRALGKEPAYVTFLGNYHGQITLQSYQPTALVDVTPLMELISPTPLLFILAEEDYLPGQRDAFAAANEPKSMVTISGNHFSPYTISKQNAIEATRE
ncbi:uncharacterized protein A1O5_09613 [Cladophialophora psammophila CBS 110553]|uniref:Acetyl xylan esterase domain-containing protein n=1 Tax=Cladophialophora psammophila CBS 110553 TaxID=1182543 RepID=W9WFS9_9EURO|nr:uncharacterized protein A1O5_09613 [Cladophialophora psammophila CBS 110553]EXJ66967.1 hypothetical protein A1O5_09613 [Cladophialophora psammophila CBS 110553]